MLETKAIDMGFLELILRYSLYYINILYRHRERDVLIYLILYL